MNHRTKQLAILSLSILAFLATTSLRVNADLFEIDWHTIDGGGRMNLTDGSPSGFELSGTTGQPDAGEPMVGGAFELVGGFWVVDATCTCPGDTNGDGLKNGSDIQRFVECLVSAGPCTCADVNGIGGVNVSDVAVFVNDLLVGATCP